MSVWVARAALLAVLVPVAYVIEVAEAILVSVWLRK